MNLRIVHEGAIYQNPYPGHQAIYAVTPDVVVVSDDELLCAYRVGNAFYSRDGRLALARSADGGQTWESEALTWSQDELESHTYKAPNISWLRDGTLLLTCQRETVNHGEDFLSFNPETGGSEPSESNRRFEAPSYAA